MAIDPKTDFEVIYVPTKGLDYSKPYNTLDKDALAPNTVNTQSINGFLTSSPWVATSPYSTALAANEFVIGEFQVNLGQGQGTYTTFSAVLIVTNVNVYLSLAPFVSGSPVTPSTLAIIHTWLPAEINTTYMTPGTTVSFVQITSASLGPVIYFTGLMLNGVFQHAPNGGGFSQSTSYVSGAYMIELAQRLVIGECRFPTGGGPTGNVQTPTIAWSGVGAFSGSGATDPWNPANFATLNGNVGGFNELTDTPDHITGLTAMGRSAEIYRDTGLTEMDPGPSGIAPWLFYHLWASQQGIGAYPGTVAQYGAMSAFRSDDNIYMFSMQGGVTAIGNRIIPKIKADLKFVSLQAGVVNNASFAFNYWYVASIVNIAGQLHYLLVLNAFSFFPGGSTTPAANCIVYDYNIGEDAWHIWDLTQYIQQNGNAGPGFLCLSTPILGITETYNFTVSGVFVGVSPSYFLFGCFTTAMNSSTTTSGQLAQVIPLDYDANSVTGAFPAFWAPIYAPLAMPITTIKCRGEIVQLGHRISQRRLRIQSMNAPFPITIVNYQGQVQVTLTGPINGTQTSAPISLNPGTLMQTSYGDVRLGDEMIQASITSVVTGGTPWLNLPLLRLSTVSILGTDTKGSTG